MGALLPFSWEAMGWCCQLYGEILTPSDIQIIEAIEEEFFESRAKAEDRRTKDEERRTAAAAAGTGRRKR